MFSSTEMMAPKSFHTQTRGEEPADLQTRWKLPAGT